jgi:hypothetical protein
MSKLQRYSPGGYGAMCEDEGGDWIRYSEIKPRIDKAIDAAVTNGLMAGSILADEGAGELKAAREYIADLEATMRLVADICNSAMREAGTDSYEVQRLRAAVGQIRKMMEVKP